VERGFFRSLFDLSFTSFITTKIIKLVYVLTLIVVAIIAVISVVAAFRESTGLGVLTLVILAPIGSLLYVVFARIALELVIQVFRITELLRDQIGMQQAAFSEAGWLRSGDPAAGSATTVSACPNCGAVPTPGAAFCRNCGHRLV